jgi:hypothetical protein
LQLTAFGARDRAYFDAFRSAPRRQLKRVPLGRPRPVLFLNVFLPRFLTRRNVVL